MTSRIIFAMVRDGALPFHKFFYVVNEKTQSPIRCVMMVFMLDSLMMLLGQSVFRPCPSSCPPSLPPPSQL